MYTLVDGNPGSGKTYYAVYKVHELSLNKRENVYHNIDDLKIGTSFHDLENNEGLTIEMLFSNSYHLNEKRFHGSLFILDEASAIFHDKYQNLEIFKFFQQHRHYGIDIILLCPDAKLLSYKIMLICELKLRAVSDTANPIPFCFCYRKLIKEESIGSVYLRKKKAVFALYKSSEFDQTKARKKSKPMLLLFIICIILIPITIYVGYKALIDREKTVTENKQTKEKNVNSTTKKEKKSDKLLNSSNDATDRFQKYPESFMEKIGGVLMPVSVIEIDKKLIIFVNDVILPAEWWPYQIIKTNGNYFSIVEEDVYNTFYKNKKSDKNTIEKDPNEKYYWKGNIEKEQNSISHAINPNPTQIN